MWKNIIEGMIDFAFGPISITEMMNNFSGLMGNEEIIDMTAALQDIILQVGIFFALIFFMKNIGEELALREDVTIFRFIRVFAKFGLTLVVLSIVTQPMNGNDTLFQEIMTMGDSFADMIQLNITESTEAMDITETMKELAATETGDYKTGPSIGFFGTLLIPWAVSAILNVYINFILITRQIMMMIMLIFAPMALSNLPEGINSPGVNYIRKFIAISFQAGVIIVIIGISQIISSVLITGETVASANGLSLAFKQVTLMAVVAGLIGKSQKFTEELFGAR